MSSSCCEHACQTPDIDVRYRRILWVALRLNVSMFLVEITASFVAGSVSLRADALDFLADALNYVIALAVVGLSLRWRASAALVKGGIMAVFGLWVAGSIVSNAIIGSVPEAHVMSSIGLLALLAECLRCDAALPAPRERQSGHVGLALHPQRLHRQYRGDSGRCRGVDFRHALA
jgi:Co/Zn/Cd efflux system component